MMWAQSLFEPNTCRLCSGISEVNMAIFSKNENSRIDHKIKRCLPISITEDDEKPKQICYSCMTKLEISYSLAEDAIASDFKFDSVIQSSYSSSIPPGNLLQNDDKDSALSHTLDPLIDQPSATGEIWQIVKSEDSPTPIEHQHLHSNSQTNSAPATVTVEHVQVHAEQLSSDSVLVLSKVEARGDNRSGDNLGAIEGTSQNGSCSDILLMVELKYKDVIGGGTSKVPTITYATSSDHSGALSQFKTGEHRVVEVLTTAGDSSSTSSSTCQPRLQIQVATTPAEAPPVAVKKFQCQVCFKSFMRRSNLNTHHNTSHSNVRPFSCDICDNKTFCTRWELTLHKRLHSGKFSCDFCDKAFTVKNKLERHRRIHTGERPFQCPHCPKAFGDKRNMDSHILCHTGEKPYSCELCGRAFRSRSHLRDHHRVHSVDKLYCCHICSKRFKWKTTLNAHLKHHAGLSYDCDLCGKSFSRHPDLKKHIISHSSERPYTCALCNKKFKDSSTFRKHLKFHDKKQYTCLQCNKIFHFESHLNQHLETHKPITCELCGVVFDKRATLKQHKKKKCN